jgi:hypothetical protein
MNLRPMLIALGLALTTAAHAQEPAKKTDPAQVRDEITASEQQIARQFADFEQALLKLTQRLKRSDKREDQERAKVLEKVLEESRSASITVQFERLVNALQGQKLTNPGEIKNLTDQSQRLADDLRRLLALMREDPRTKQVQDDRKKLEQLIKELDRIIHSQKGLQAQTELGKTDPKELRSNQNKVSDATARLAKDLGKFGDKNEKSGEGKNTKGDAKEAGKEGGKAGESKDAGKDAQAKAGESKDSAKGGEPKTAAKGNDGPKSAAAKGNEKSAEAKGNEKPAAEAKAGIKSSKNQEAAKSEPKSSGQPKQGEAKPGADSKGQSQAKGDGQPQQQQSQPQQAAQKGDSPQQKQPPSQSQQPQDDVAQAKKRVEDGNYQQRRAEDELQKKDNQQASAKQADAIKELEKAKKELEKLLRQMREEEMERLLAALQARCEKMLAMQMQVLAGTEATEKSILGNPDQKPKHENKQESLRLSDLEKDIVVEANKAIEMLEAEGSAVAFPEVFMQVREDMKHVQRRLEVTDVGAVTQTIERDIIETLKEMIEALKKARQELDNKQSNSNNSNSQPPDQKLLDQIAELKMIRSLQLRVNARTQVYGKQYEAREGEQTADPNLRRELNNLAERQERIFDITNRIAKGDNR